MKKVIWLLPVMALFLVGCAGNKVKPEAKVVIQKMLKGQNCDLESSNLTKREWNELMESFGFKEKIL